MKKQVVIEHSFCDNCGSRDYTYKCLGCKTEVCYKCKEKVGREFSHAVHFSGSSDGFFCSKCLVEPPEKVKSLLYAYLAIDALKDEYKGWWENFDKRSKKAEEYLKTFNVR